MSTYLWPGLARTRDLVPLAFAEAMRRAGVDERMPIVRTGEREPISPLLRQLVFRRDGYRCVWCGSSPWASDKHRRCTVLHLDHLNPWSAGGPDRSDNLRTLCDSCNGGRSNYRADMETYVAVPIVARCAPCLPVIASAVPSVAFDVYCATGSHYGWVIPGWKIL